MLSTEKPTINKAELYGAGSFGFSPYIVSSGIMEDPPLYQLKAEQTDGFEL